MRLNTRRSMEDRKMNDRTVEIAILNLIGESDCKEKRVFGIDIYWLIVAAGYSAALYQ